MLYASFKVLVSICFNLLNRILGGQLPPFGCASIIVERNGQFLVVELSRGKLVFPGGFMHWQELPTQAAEREGKEETGLDLHAHQFINIYPYKSRNIRSMSTFLFVYSGEVVGGELRQSMEGIPRWVSESELRRRFGSFPLRILDDYLHVSRLQQEDCRQKTANSSP
jgi:ADP-ribose pyrophosphatase YjhB (NUDIX family)